MNLYIYFLFITFSNAFINKCIISRSSIMNSMRMPIRESKYIYQHRISINYKLSAEQVNLIQNNINQHTDNFIIYPIDNDYLIKLDLYLSMSNRTIELNSYISILVKDIYINIYGEYILNKLEPNRYQTINRTNPFYYFYSNESSISLYINKTDDKLIDNSNRHNISFIYDNITESINYISQIKPINRYLVNTSYISRLVYQNMTFYTADKITYTSNDYIYDLFK